MMKAGWDKDNPAYRQVFASLFMPDATPQQVRQFNEWMRLTTSPAAYDGPAEHAGHLHHR
jgi:formiminotetrahydrofolate cyclodeaminase